MALALRAWAFNPPIDGDGPLNVEIKAPDRVTSLGVPVNVDIMVSNSGRAALRGRLEVWVIDNWRIGPVGKRKIERPVHPAPGGAERISLVVTAGPETFNAHYPIHARVTCADPESAKQLQAHAIKIVLVDSPPSPKKKPRGPAPIRPGVTSLLKLVPARVALRVGANGQPRSLGAGWHGSDKQTRAVFAPGSADRPGRMACLSVHPPWRGGWGTIWADYDLVLPDAGPITLAFSTAIRDNTAKEPPSDGVEFKVFAAIAGSEAEPRPATREIFRRFTKSKFWENASIDLSPFAGRRITLRLWTGPGPNNNTVCDQGYWGNPVIVVGSPPPAPRDIPHVRRWAIRRAGAARRGEQQKAAWLISSETGFFGVSYNQGEGGPADAAIAIVGENKSLVFDGFDIQVDGTPLGEIPAVAGNRWSANWENGRFITERNLLCANGPMRVRAEIWVEAGALRCRFSMPGVKRDKRGHPRFTLLGLGAVVAPQVNKARRVYAGFGNVVEKPGRFDLRGDGFRCSTRHVGVDFENGLSIVQAADIFPDRFVVDPKRGLYSLETHHDATISLFPSEKGAFAAARVYREGIARFKPSPGYKRLAGRMCLDYWGTSYQHGIDTVEALAKYGVTDCVYVWHNWQRWGYDYRLPEIYPARGDHALFVRLAETCRKHGILFCPHDNYIDFYPDAEGFSYRHIIFNEDGTPQRAWYNRGRQARSYRWLPHAFLPWTKKNVALLKQDVRPTAYFIDVFTAIMPMDYYDIDGRFYPKTETIRRWGECFDYVREQFGGAPQISEAGHDTQIGHIAAGESDHMGVVPNGSGRWGWYIPCADGERVPWHDMASHGSFILFAGGLANRYVGAMDPKTHGYGSDDYWSLTVLGGRNPMAHGDASPETIRTYWLLHDICAELGRRPMASHEFAGDDIHRQIVRFGDDAVVRVNRGKENWKLAKGVLPQYGFIARAGNVRADVMLRDGVRTSFAESPRAIFADARPQLGGAKNDRKVIDFGPVATNGAFRLVREPGGWRVLLVPGCPPSEIRFQAGSASLADSSLIRIEKLDRSGAAVGQVSFTRKGGEVTFQTVPGDFAYRVKYQTPYR